MARAAALHESLALARRLVDAIEAGNSTETDDLIKALNDGRFEALFKEIGKLTRELHDTFGNLVADDRLIALARQHMPDARDRLHYVVLKTEEAANRTLNAVEVMIPMSDTLVQQAVALRNAIEAGADVLPLTGRVCQFLDRVEHDGRTLRSRLTDVLMAQEYQDLTGQVIKRTIDLVSQVEGKLVELVCACGAVAGAPTKAAAETSASSSHGPAVRDEEQVMRRQSDVDELLANLGF